MRDQRGRDEASDDALAGGHAAPGRRTLTQSLPPATAAVGPVQRKAAAGPAPADDPFGVHLGGPAKGAPPPLIVDDDAEVGPGQMTKSQFLAELRAAVTETAIQVLDPTWSAAQCPDLQRIFAHYATLDADTVEGIMKRFGRAIGAATPLEYVARVCARIAGTVQRWGAGEEMSWDIGAAGVPEAVGGVVQLHGRGGTASAVTLDPARDLGGASALDGATAGRMGEAFGDSFGDVLVHTDGAAAAKTSAMGADALATGNHIAFAAGEYRPGTPDGDGLIAHELAHVIQQRGAVGEVQRRAVAVETSSAHEQDADTAADAVVARLHHGIEGDAPIRPALTVGGGVQRGNRTSSESSAKPSIVIGGGPNKGGQPPSKPPSKDDDKKEKEPEKPKPKPRPRAGAILGGLRMPEKNPKWNYDVDTSPEEKYYNDVERILEQIASLRDYAESRGLILETPLTAEQGRAMYEQHGAGASYSSSYHSAGGQNKPQVWIDAATAGYDLSNEEIRTRVGQIADAYHSLMYLSDVSRTGKLI